MLKVIPPPPNEFQIFHTAVGFQNAYLTNRHPYYLLLVDKNTSEVVKMNDKLLSLEDSWWFINDKLVFLNLNYN